MKYLYIILLGVISTSALQAQNLEIMQGDKNLFIDVQWLKPIVANKDSWTIFNRTRATVDNGTSQLFNGTYLNYTTKNKIGLSLTGKLTNSDNAIEIGPHFRHNSNNLYIFILASWKVSNELSYSLFVITRWRPKLSDKLKLFSSLELFSSFQENKIDSNVQRIRLGLDMKFLQFGFASNINTSRSFFKDPYVNTGVFIRKEF